MAQLEKAEGSIASFGQSMAKALRAHAVDHEVTCDKCGSSNVRHVEGCMECADWPLPVQLTDLGGLWNPCGSRRRIPFRTDMGPTWTGRAYFC